MKEANGIKLYSSKEISEMLGTSYTFVLKRIKRGTIPAVRLGKNYFVSEEALAEYLNGKTEGAIEPTNIK